MAAGEPSARAGRQALYAAVDRVCDEIDRELAAEKEKNKRLLQQLHQSSDDGQADPPPINRQPARECTKPGFKAPQPTASSGVSRPQANSASTPPNSSNLPCSTTSSGTLDMAALKAKHVDLQRRFNALAANFKTAKEAIRKRSGERDMLKRRTSYLENAIACAEAKHGITILGERGPSPPAAAPALSGSFLRQNVDDVVGVRPAACHEAKERNGPSPSTASTQEETDEGPEEQLPKLSRDDPADSSLVKQEPSSDTPLVVSERTLKKRKRGDSIPNEANSRLKSEPSGQSSPLLSLIRHVPNTQESSLDLGDIEQRMTTPRKRTVVGIFEPGNVSVASPDMQTPVVHRAVLCGASEQSSEAVGDSVLAPLSVNVRKSGIGEDKAKVRPPRRGLGFAISVLAEDGDAYGANASTFKRSGARSMDNVAKGRLGRLLNNTAPATADPVIPRPARRNEARDGLLIPERRELPFERGGAQPERGSPDRGQQRPRPGTPPKEANAAGEACARGRRGGPASALRGRPLSELQLDDFKINPVANDGHDFAFAEVVRDKGERACLPGCTDPHCCGKQFKGLAAAERPDAPLTPAQRLEEQRLLEWYLGDDAYRLAGMGRDERAELWVEARAQELANKYGRHRHRFSRMQSPPGFWNADFPSTQELRADREEAARRERKAVAERYREASRAGGRWIFRDE